MPLPWTRRGIFISAFLIVTIGLCVLDMMVFQVVGVFEFWPLFNQMSLVRIGSTAPKATLAPSQRPTEVPTPDPTEAPMLRATPVPTPSPTKRPTLAPTLSPTTVTSEKYNLVNSTLWTCGFNYPAPWKWLFPEYASDKQLASDNVHLFKETDMAIVNLHEPCPGSERPTDMVWLKNNFPGNILFVNVEPYLDDAMNTSDRFYQISLLPDSSHNVHVLVATVLFFAHYSPLEFAKLSDHSQKVVNTQKHFLIYASNGCVPFREEAFDRLSEIAEVHHGAWCKGTNNNTKRVFQNVSYTPDVYKLNPILYNDYRFCLVMENRQVDGYISEKIISAFLGGCVPIYFGTTEVFQVFNKDAFVFYDMWNPEAALARIAYLERNRTAYNEMLEQPILANGSQTIEEYFSFVEEVGNGTIRKKIRTMLNLATE